LDSSPHQVEYCRQIEQSTKIRTIPSFELAKVHVLRVYRPHAKHNIVCDQDAYMEDLLLKEIEPETVLVEATWDGMRAK
jgi:hypothetical protein